MFPYPGCVPTISANGVSNGIVWAIDQAGLVRAYDATNVAVELYDSNRNSARDALGSPVRFSVPTVANGKVYIGTQNALVVYGPLGAPITGIAKILFIIFILFGISLFFGRRARGSMEVPQ